MTSVKYTQDAGGKLQRSDEEWARLIEVAAEIDKALAAHAPTPDDTFYATRPDGSRREIQMPFYAAPNCDGDLLAHPPLIVRDTSEQPFVMLQGVDGRIGPKRERVVKVARLTARNQYGRYDLVLVLTDEAAYVMRGADFDRQQWLDEIEIAPADEDELQEQACGA